ncbi:MAG: ComEC/Rec2 family competence protein [Patescibacteria group bacterium]|jgi:competence protein ComEC
MIKKISLITLSIGVVLFLAIYTTAKNDSALKIHFLDVGQGDAILIRTPEHQDILIDGGPGNLVVDEIGKYLLFYDRDIEIMILTHAHSDHVSGLVEVLKRYEVDQVLFSGNVDHDAPDYLAWLGIIEQKSIPLIVATCCKTYQLGNQVELQILYPFEDYSGKELEDLNESSLVSRLVYKDRKFLFTGDAPLEVEEKIIEKDLPIESDVLKVGHHGSKYSSGELFLDAVNPDYAVIQSGEGNSFGHPHFKTVNNLQKRNVEMMRTDQCGTIIMETNGNDLKLSSERCDL